MWEDLLNEFSLAPSLPLSVVVARTLATVVFCGLIGLERETSKRPAGLRTHMLIGLASCIYCLLTLALLAPHMGNMRDGFGYASVGLLVVWLLPWPAVYFAPEGINGAAERIAALAMIAWMAMASWFMIQKGRGVLPKD